ncbi:MAG: endonuclease domain-containing protein [Candidatus Brocadiales bacterium]
MGLLINKQYVGSINRVAAYLPSPSMGEGRVGVSKIGRQVVAIAKNLRKKSTNAESLLWKHLRSKQLEGLKFRRQQPIGNYIVDLVCFEKRIITKVDGRHHAREKGRDNEKDDGLKKQGFKVLRFWNNDVLTNISGVLEVIVRFTLPYPLPSREGVERNRAVKGGRRCTPRKGKKRWPVEGDGTGSGVLLHASTRFNLNDRNNYEK